MNKPNKIRNVVLLSFLAFGVGFPAAIIVANRPAKLVLAPVAPKGEVEIGPVTIVDQITSETHLAPPVKATTRKVKGHTASTEPHDCRPVMLEQQGRPDHSMVWTCEGTI